MSKRRPLPLPVEEIPCVLRLPDLKPPLDWQALFGRRSVVELEIGAGKGLFVRSAAAARTESDFLAVERAAKYFHRAVERIHEAEQPNVRLVRADAFDLLTRWVPAESVDHVHVYFPDPWPKQRHHKRRLLQPALFGLIARALKPGGRFWLGSDVGPYFETAVKQVDALGRFTREPWPEDAPDRIHTSYALKYIREGRELHYARFLRLESGAQTDPRESTSNAEGGSNGRP